MTENQIQQVQDEAVKILRDYAELTFREAIEMSLKIMMNKEEIENDRERI